jgi:hypothetical protein
VNDVNGVSGVNGLNVEIHARASRTESLIYDDTLTAGRRTGPAASMRLLVVRETLHYSVALDLGQPRMMVIDAGIVDVKPTAGL